MFLADVKGLNVPEIIAVVQLINCHVQIYVIVPVANTKIVWNKLTFMRYSMTIMILVNIKMKTPMEKQMTPVIAKMTYLPMMK